MAKEAGAALELMDDAWWGASVAPVENGEPSFIVGERSLPYSIIVDARGSRFANEAESYVDLGHHMLEHDRDGVYWFILDVRHRRRYLRTFALDPRAQKARRPVIWLTGWRRTRAATASAKAAATASGPARDRESPR